MVVNATYSNYKGYDILGWEEEEKGIFLRSPIQKVFFSADPEYFTGVDDVYSFHARIKNPFRKLLQILIGNKNQVDNIDEWLKDQDCDWCGFNANKLVSPIYFTRKSRYIEVTTQSKDDYIRSIRSHGYEDGLQCCSGSCAKEKTTIVTKSGTKKITCYDKYHFTYTFKIEELLKGVVRNEDEESLG